jgi:hypothetical protein
VGGDVPAEPVMGSIGSIVTDVSITKTMILRSFEGFGFATTSVDERRGFPPDIGSQTQLESLILAQDERWRQA